MRPTRRQRTTRIAMPRRSKTRQRRTYAAMITSLDDQVGRIVAALEKKDLRENTLIIFCQRQRRAASALVRQRRARPRRSAHEGGGSSRSVSPGDQRRSPRRQGQPARRRRPRAGHLQLAGQTQAARRQRTAAHGGHHAHRARAGRWQGEP